MNIDKIVAEFQEKVRAGLPPVAKNPESDDELTIIPDPEFGRLTATIDMDKALKLYNIYRYTNYYMNNYKQFILFIIFNNIVPYNYFRSNCFDEDTRLRRCSLEFKLKLETLNNVVFNEVQGHLIAAVDNSISGIRYFRVQPDGPKLTKVSVTNPLVPR